METTILIVMLVSLSSPLMAIGALTARKTFRHLATSYPEDSAARRDCLLFVRIFAGFAKWALIVGGFGLVISVVGLSFT